MYEVLELFHTRGEYPVTPRYDNKSPALFIILTGSGIQLNCDDYAIGTISALYSFYHDETAMKPLDSFCSSTLWRISLPGSSEELYLNPISLGAEHSSAKALHIHE